MAGNNEEKGMTEYVILVDDNDAEVGREEKMETHRRGLLHRAFSVMLVQGDKILLHRRALEKYHSGGLWSNACCGHPRPGETVEAGARRRLFEEMGIDCPQLEWRAKTHYSCPLDGGMSENEIVHLLFAEYDGPIEPDPGEVMDWAWRDLATFRAEAQASPDYTYWLKTYVARGLI
jgi:isopentenyl-diphosphate delta-isomerase